MCYNTLLISNWKYISKNTITMAQQTAIEWLKKELEDYGSSSHLNLDWTTFDELCEQAKQLEKEQIFDSFKSGLKSPYHQGYTLLTEDGQEETKSGQYYNETYNKL